MRIKLIIYALSVNDIDFYKRLTMKSELVPESYIICIKPVTVRALDESEPSLVL